MNARKLTGVCVALLFALAACSSDAKPTGPAVTIAAPADATTVKGNTVSLELTATELTVVKADGDTTGKSGHYHVFIDREPVAVGAVIPKESGIVHSAKDSTLLTGLSVGAHSLAVVLGDGAHRRLAGVARTIRVTVEGPSIDASAPATATAGQAISLTVAVTGVTLVKADGAAAGTTGHLHVLVDGDPPAAGQPIAKQDGIIHTTETTIQVPALAAGEHTIWVVLGDGSHVPYSPPVMDKVVVTVSA